MYLATIMAESSLFPFYENGHNAARLVIFLDLRRKIKVLVIEGFSKIQPKKVVDLRRVRYVEV